MARRGSNIYKRKDGRYEGRINIGCTESGKTKYRYVYGHTLSEVKEKMAVSYASDYQESNKCKMTLEELSEQWLNEKRLTVKQSSYNSYRNLLKNHVYPAIGSQKYTDLSKKKLNSYISDLLESGRMDGRGGLSSKTIRDVVAVIKSVCRYAYVEYKLPDPAENIKAPRTEKCVDELSVLNKDERKILTNYLMSNQSLTNIGILLCLFSGIRVGELCALQWSDINIQSRKISITKTLQRISQDDGSTKIVIGSPKSSSSVRDIWIPDFVCEVVKKHKSASASYILSNNGTPVEPRTMQNRFKAILRDCGVRDVKFHGLRHTYATMCIENGFDAKTLSELLGHADVNITLNRYVHSSDEIKKYYVDRLRPIV